MKDINPIDFEVIKVNKYRTALVRHNHDYPSYDQYTSIYDFNSWKRLIPIAQLDNHIAVELQNVQTEEKLYMMLTDGQIWFDTEIEYRKW